MAHSLKLEDLAEADRRLAEMAQAASAHAYAPYSGFAVGAAVRTVGGQIYCGANLENASYGVGMCAEVAALTAANSAGDFNVEAIAVIGHKFIKPRVFSIVVTPCGRCRQLIFEAAQISTLDVRVISCNGNLSEVTLTGISELLPDAFGPRNLGLDKVWRGMQLELRNSVADLAAAEGKATA